MSATTHRTRRLTRAAVIPGALALTALAAAPAAAHVGITPDNTAAGAYTVLTVSVPHGCDGSPTKRIAIQMPEEILSVTPTRNPLYTVKTVMETLDEPIDDGEGGQVTERVDQVVYETDTPLPEGQRDAFELSLQLPETPGETLTFPIIQTCTQGETGWTEVAAEGQNPHDLEHPAPTVEVTAAEEEGHGVVSDAAAEQSVAEQSAAGSEPTSAEAPAAANSDDGSNALGITGLIAGLLGLAAGAAALVMVRRRA